MPAIVKSTADTVLDKLGPTLTDTKTSVEGRGRMLSMLARLNQPQVAQAVLSSYARMEPALQPRLPNAPPSS